MLLALVQASLAATLTVGTTGTYATIQSAINASSSGDTILVQPGTYRECLSLSSRTLSLESTDGSGVTAIEGLSSCSDSGVSVGSGARVTVRGFSISNAYARAVISLGAYLHLEDVIIQASGRSNLHGGAIYQYRGQVTLQDCVLQDNIANEGGAIWLDGASQLWVYDSLIADNSAADSGGGIFMGDNYTGAAELVMERSTVTGNTAQLYGGAIYGQNSTSMEVYDSELSENVAWDFGGAVSHFAGSRGTAYFEGTLFADNSTRVTTTSAEGGGAMYGGIHTELVDCVFSNNSSQGRAGGAFFAEWSAGDLIVSDTVFSGNSGYKAGGMYVAFSSTTHISDSSFTGNASTSTGGALMIHSASSATVLDLTGSSFRGNTGGALLMYGRGQAEVSETVFACNQSSDGRSAVKLWLVDDATFVRNTLVANSMGSGAVLSLVDSQADISGSAFAYNSGSYGVEVDIDSAATFSYNLWYQNLTDHAAMGAGLVIGSDGNLEAEPEFKLFTDDGDCSTDMFIPAAGSPMVDAGPPTLLDADGSRADIGVSWDAGSVPPDEDGDGFDGAYDCDDTDAAVHPGAAETWYDGIDQDCSGGSDHDQDGDGFELSGDCDDEDDTVHPGAAETWYDGVDQDCSGGSDHDQDGDGVDIGADCEDGDAAISPGAAELWYDGVDQDCSGDSDRDQDGDGVQVGEDCDDTDSASYPGAAETWYDGVDQDCSGGSDHDQDGDGVALSLDCDDTDAGSYPGAAELWYDGVDQDCSGGSDHDQDGDGAELELDCDDEDESVHPGALEQVDGLDNDCNGEVDEVDSDGDGWTDLEEAELGTDPFDSSDPAPSEPGEEELGGEAGGKGSAGCSALGGGVASPGLLGLLLGAALGRRRRKGSGGQSGAR